MTPASAYVLKPRVIECNAVMQYCPVSHDKVHTVALIITFYVILLLVLSLISIVLCMRYQVIGLLAYIQ